MGYLSAIGAKICADVVLMSTTFWQTLADSPFVIPSYCSLGAHFCLFLAFSGCYLAVSCPLHFVASEHCCLLFDRVSRSTMNSGREAPAVSCPAISKLVKRTFGKIKKKHWDTLQYNEFQKSLGHFAIQ